MRLENEAIMPNSKINDSAARIAYQGEPGANSHLAAVEAFPDLEPAAYPTFEDALAADTVEAWQSRLREQLGPSAYAGLTGDTARA